MLERDLIFDSKLLQSIEEVWLKELFDILRDIGEMTINNQQSEWSQRV